MYKFVRSSLSLGGNVSRILLLNEPMFSLRQENTHNEGKEIWKFFIQFFFRYLAVGDLESLYVYYTNFILWFGIKHGRCW